MAANPILLEISVETVEAAVAAQRGGAQRIELCADLRLGGLTPSAELMRSVRASVNLPIFAMIRPRAGNFDYSDIERQRMRLDIAIAQRAGMDGIVLGMLVRGARIDVWRTDTMVGMAAPLPVTFHRAFDEVTDLDAALTDVTMARAARILTSGGANCAADGIKNIARLVAAAKKRVIIVPGGGINASNVVQIATQTGAREIHSGLGSVLAYGHEDYSRFEDEVREMAALLASVG